ncbi:aldose epimerase family protein [Actinomadura flavalba]|uniref:aldose epimerase family protein n=1 Tax=Actinomadura flavalba TaxID=1120938 RepID=UPI00037D042D|nr:aldose epimerase family protein [Actinomadura flavalba]
MGITAQPFGTLPDGTGVQRYLLTDGDVRVRVLTYGGIVQSADVPGRDGRTANVVLGFGSLDDYVRHNADPHFGGLIGRFANRIAGARFMLDGVEHRLPANDGGNTLHGGPEGFDRRVWAAESDGSALRLTYVSADGEEGFPGRLTATVTYTLADGALTLDYTAVTDAPTVVNLTSHTYVNLAGEGAGDVRGHVLRVAASRYVPVDDAGLPTGGTAPVAGGPFDLTAARPIGPHVYDHTFVLDDGPGPAVHVSDPGSGRTLDVTTTQPGVQVYTGNFLDGSLTGTGGVRYAKHAGLALETQHFPDSPHHPDFPSTTLRPGETYRSTTTFTFGVA